MKFSLYLLFFFTVSLSFAQTHLYVHDDADAYVTKTENMAIIPFDVQVKLRPKQLKDFTSEQIAEMEFNEGLDVQRAMHSWFLKRKKRGSMSIEVQSPSKTNALLKKAGIDLHELDAYLVSELAEILGVDAIIKGSMETSKPMSDAANIAIGVLFGGFGASSQGIINMDIVNAEDDELVVNYNKKVKGGLGTNADDMINTLMRKVTRRIPYTQ
ncbi:hypothetical protein [Sediminicola sp. 1XM1-17]|uniref:hypothetical protein n=1 Tax=Sediminicola sp. 1XM1-17 TaxID=3127702 RepID=UPI003077514E